MWLVVGLGNPGEAYARNRHNIGFMAVDEMSRVYSFSPWRKKHHGFCAEGTISGCRVLLVKPETFMNDSGRAVGDVARFYKVNPSHTIVLHDEIELLPGHIRLKQGGGHAGHNGLRDIDAHIGKAYWRIRLGVGRPHDKTLVHGWVLSDFAKSDTEWLDTFLDAVASYFPLVLSGDHANFMNKVHLSVRGTEKKTSPAHKTE